MRLVNYSNPVLHHKIEQRAKWAEVEEILLPFLDVLIDNDGIGLAANQVGLDRRFFVAMFTDDMLFNIENFNYRGKSRGPIAKIPTYNYRGFKFIIFLDPLVWYDTSIFPGMSFKGPYETTEGCLSISTIKDTRKHLHDIRGGLRRKYIKTLANGRPSFRIRREHSLGVFFRSIDDIQYELVTGGLLAQIIQHEIDHLNGLTLVDRCNELIELEGNKDV